MRSPIIHDISILEYFIAFSGVKSKEADILSFGASNLITKFSQSENIIFLSWLGNQDSASYNPAYLQSVSSLADYCTLAHENIIALAILIKIGNHKKAIDCMSDILIDLIICPNSFSKSTIMDIEKNGKFLGNKIILDASLHDSSSNKLLLLLDLSLFFKEFRASRYFISLKIINALKIVPVNYSQINQCLEKLNSYPRKFIYIFRLVLVSTILILREQASAILSFTAQLPFPLPRFTRSQILADLSDIRKKS
ncbi:hypothetical protein MXB_1287 [Myxobolus squamalis]|nr:hypothetical protein MXB_1287 [Myxobolus squamalis]